MNVGRLHTAWLVPSTMVAAAAGFATGNMLLFPLFCMAPAYPLMIRRLLAGQRGRAVCTMLVWAATLAPTSVMLSFWAPEQAAATVLRGEVYADEMFHWLRTGEGRESRPAEFLVEHAVHLVLFTVLSLATASLASIYFGTVLLNYMAYYVARVIQAADGDLLAGVMAWHPWSLVRVASFVVLGVVLAEPLLRRISGSNRVPGTGRGRWLFLVLAGLVLDVVVKAMLAPSWRQWLVRLTG